MIQHRGCHLIFDPELISPHQANVLQSGALQDAVTSRKVSTGGRGQAWFVELEGLNGVLRCYQRGGLLARVNRQTYLGLDIQQSRAFREWKLLERMYREGLPVPRPIAASVCRWPFRFSPLYRAHILVQRIDGAQTLDQYLSQQSLPLDLWSRVGACIAAFHQKGIYHADLNANNILIDPQQAVTLIDFDKGEQRDDPAPDAEWKLANLQRLHRSLLKQQGIHPQYHFEDMDWQVMLAGYRGIQAGL